MSGAETGKAEWDRRRVLSLAGRLVAGGAAAATAACTPDSENVQRPSADVPHPPRDNGDGPNIVLVVLDDAGYGDFGPQRRHPMIRTPRLHQIADQGMHFTQMYAGASVCSPSRAALLTGRYAPRVGIPTVLHPWQDIGLSEYEDTVAELLRRSGYRTGVFGKWHMGSRPRHNPLRHGFDRYVGLLHSNDQEPLRLYRGRRPTPGPVEQSRLTRLYTDEAIGFIEQDPSKPFFVYLPHTAPHVPLHVEPRFRDTSPAGVYGDALQAVDFHVGRLLDKLDELGLSENTLVMVTSDNGPWFQGSTGGLRGRKTQSYEGGVRVPFLLRWPRRVRPGTACESPASFVDLLPTLVKLGGGTVPTDRPLDGLDISPVLRQGAMPPREALYYFQKWQVEAVRSGPWKLHLSGARRSHRHQRRQLYNIDVDPAEHYDQGPDHPAVVRRLTTLADRFEDEIAEQRPEAVRRARRG